MPIFSLLFWLALHIFLLLRRVLGMNGEAQRIGQSMPMLLFGLLVIQL